MKYFFKFRFVRKTLFLLALFFFLFFILVLICWTASIQPVSDSKETQNFVIPKGLSASLIGERLKEKRLIRSSLAFKIYIQITARQEKIQAGEYKISPSWNLIRIVDQFIKGPANIWVTIPEGLRREEIAERFISLLGKGKDEEAVFRKEFLDLTKEKEGFLFPDTYLFPQTASASSVVSKLTSTFEKKVDSKTKSTISKSSYSLNDVVSVASLVERETRTDEERPIVAGIIYKRLSKNWPLQIDASIQYLAASNRCREKVTCNWWQTLVKNDLKLNSSYNTYKFPGLPPTPICSPGLSSIMAAIYPKNSPYWFYLHDTNGNIHFAETIEEHNRNISVYLGK